jgi:hypothetical protein
MMPKYIQWNFLFKIEKTSEADPDAKGTIGEKSDKAVAFSTKVTGGLESAVDWSKNTCYADRNGFKVCHW